MVIEIPHQVSQHGGGSCWNHFIAVGVPVLALEAVGAHAVHQHRDICCEARGHGEQHTPFPRRNPRRRLERHDTLLIA